MKGRIKALRDICIERNKKSGYLNSEIFIYRMFSRCCHSVVTVWINYCNWIIVTIILLEKSFTKYRLRKHLNIKSLVSEIQVWKKINNPLQDQYNFKSSLAITITFVYFWPVTAPQFLRNYLKVPVENITYEVTGCTSNLMKLQFQVVQNHYPLTHQGLVHFQFLMIETKQQMLHTLSSFDP